MEKQGACLLEAEQKPLFQLNFKDFVIILDFNRTTVEELWNDIDKLHQLLQ
ncbi:hypothetical protein [Pedobacter psychrodurus]|uniref:hypothetical protein n=1 Tax=Pedobacter psychrodurus TaxID=2530456 RepID=UPI0013F1731D|nr:hypothetical protein [Pedobacter psychrodurus]